MWRNTDVLDFIGWLRHWNDAVNDHKHKGMVEQGVFSVGFYGLDLYSMNASINSVLAYLREKSRKSTRVVCD